MEVLNKATVFIGVPTINRPLLVKETVQSVLNQRFKSWRLMVSDNGSTQGVRYELKHWIQSLNDDRVSFYEQPENHGEYGQGRLFFEAAQSDDYFMMLHDDDLLHVDFLQKAVDRLEQQRGCACYVADPWLIDDRGARDQRKERRYLAEHGRVHQKSGPYAIKTTHLQCGFTPVSATLFRMGHLRITGFVDQHRTGNYPFESDIFLRLADHNVEGWYQKEPLISVRFHEASMRNYIKLLDNQQVVESMIELFASRCYDADAGAEKLRLKHLGKLYRAKALIDLRMDKTDQARKAMLASLQSNLRSIKSWLLAPWMLLIPTLLRALLPALPKVAEAPQLSNASTSVTRGETSQLEVSH